MKNDGARKMFAESPITAWYFKKVFWSRVHPSMCDGVKLLSD